jgi:uncharacterized integral membrane protein
MFETTNDLANYLSPNERVLWEGRGQRRWSLASNTGVTFAAIFGGVMFLIVLVFIIVGVMTSRSTRSSPPPEVFIIPLIIFVIIGLSVGIPLFLMSRQTGNARYVVTSSAALIVSRGALTGRRVTVIPLKNLAQISLTENRDGTGTLMFGQSLYAGYGRYSNSWFADSVPAFSNIERPLEVYQLIRKQMNEA